MSGVTTHALIGAVGGLALVRLTAVPLAPSVVIGASALLAVWPDIDEPQSWISRRARWLITVAVAGALAWIGRETPLRFGGAALPGVWQQLFAQASGGATGLLVGATLFGPLLGFAVLWLIRRSAGGHRYGTHSLVIGGLLLLGAGLLPLLIPAAASGRVLLVALWWGQLLHVMGDVVTAHGVALFWPMSSARIVVLPRSLRPWGEPIVQIGALIVGASLLTQ